MQIMWLMNKFVVLCINVWNNFQMNIALVLVDHESCSCLDSSSIDSAVYLISWGMTQSTKPLKKTKKALTYSVHIH